MNYFEMPGGSFDGGDNWFRSTIDQLPGPTPAPQPKPMVAQVADAVPLAAGSFGPSGAPTLSWPQGPVRVAGQALRLGRGELVTSPTVCLRPNEPSVRFFYRGPGTVGTTLRVTVYLAVRDSSGNVTSKAKRQTVLEIPAVAGDSAWRLSPVVLTKADLRTTDTDLFVSFQVRSTDPAVPTPGEWLVDNVLVDPFRVR